MKVVDESSTVVSRQRKPFSFVCEDNEQSKSWVDAIRTILHQNDTSERFLVFLDNADRNAVNVWNSIKTILDIANTTYELKPFDGTITFENIRGMLLIATDNKIYQLLNVLYNKDENYAKVPIAIIPSKISTEMSYPPSLLSFLQNPVMIAFSVIKSNK